MSRSTRGAFAVAIFLGLGLGILLTFHGSAMASRNASGTYTSPSADFVADTVISSNVVNTKFSDLGTEITDSLSRSGKGGMLARLRGVDGTAALPAYAFTAETTLGLYRAGSNDIRMSDNATDVQKWSGTGTTIYQAITAEKGVTVTNSTTNGAGTTSTGNGTGAGVVATGGATGNGGTFTGGATSGIGVAATSTGGSTAITATGGGTNARGITATATGTETGLHATGGSSNGVGVTAVGGGSAGAGLVAAAGAAATATTRTNAISANNGDIDMSNVTEPNSDVAIANALTPSNIPKALSRISMAVVNTPVLEWGFNISGVAMDGSTDDQINITFAQDFADADEVVVVTGSQYYVATTAISTTGASFQLYAPGSATPLDLDTVTGIRLSITAFGRQ